MLKIENLLMASGSKCYRKRKGVFEIGISYHGKSISLGSYKNEDDAKRKVLDFKIKRLIEGLSEYGETLKDYAVYHGKYIVFKSGNIFNLFGKKIIGHINRDGYVNGILDGKNTQFHRVIALSFLPRIDGKDFVNHKDGNKMNNCVDNLEWCNRSENTLHSFKNGLQKVIHNQYGIFEVKKYA